MSIAEQKVALLKIIVDADETTTNKLFDFIKSLDISSPDFSEEDLAEFNKRRAAYLNNPHTAVPWEQSMANLRERLSK